MRTGVVTNATDWRSHALQGRCKFQGLPISIENERGSYRQGEEPNGRMWRTFMHIAYGYVRLTEGTDGDHVDCYIGPIKTSDRVFIIHQQVPETKVYDEDKVMLGFNSGADAKAAYVRQYDRPGFFQSMEEHDMATFKQMLKDRKGMKLKKSWDEDEEDDEDEEKSERDKEFEKEHLAEEAKDRRPKKFAKGKRMPVGTISRGRKKVAEGKWVTVPVRNQFGVIENVRVTRTDPLAQMYLKKQEAVAKKTAVRSTAVEELEALGISSVKDIDSRMKPGETRYSALSRMVGVDAADFIMRELEVKGWGSATGKKYKRVWRRQNECLLERSPMVARKWLRAGGFL